MSRLKGIRKRLHLLLKRRAADLDMDDELRFHIEMQTEQNLRSGMPPAEARRRALLAFGSVEVHRDELRRGRSLPWLETVVRDVRFACRALIRGPGFALAAILTLALGIGATTSVFSAMNAVLLSPLHPESDRLVRIYLEHSPDSRGTLSVVDYRAIESRQRSFSGVGAAYREELPVLAGDEPVHMPVGSATAGFFQAVGISVERGRGITAEDEEVGAPPVAVIGAELAARTFGGRAETALGNTIAIDGVHHTIVGVLPEGVSDIAGIRAEIWPALQLPEPQRRGPFGLVVVARLREGVTVDAARHDLEEISVRIFPEWEASFQNENARLVPVPLREAILGRAARTLWMFALAAALVMLIALVNVTSLNLVRAAGRSRELALRKVLGASHRRVARQLVTESVVLTVCGAILGVVLAAAMLRALTMLAPTIPNLGAAHIDLSAFAFAGGLALLAGIMVGVYPILTVFRGDLPPHLRAGTARSSVTRNTSSVRGLLVSVEFALALPLLFCAGLLLNSFLQIQQVDPGFDPSNLLAVSISLPEARYGESAEISAYWQQALSRVEELPGVEGAGVSTTVPPEMPWNQNNFDLLARPFPEGAQPIVPWPSVTPEFFTVLRVPLLEGRMFGPVDSAGAPPVVLVSRAWEQRYSPDRSAVGLQLVSGGCTTCPPTTVVGVVSDVKYGGLTGTTEAVYEPLAQGPPFLLRSATLFVRSSSPTGPMLNSVRQALRSVDPAVPLDIAGPLEERVYASAVQPRHWATLIGGYALVALGLAAVGIFGMLSYLVNSGRREIGIRVALGAQRGEVVGQVVRRGMTYAIGGAAAGLILALVATRGIEGSLFGVSPADPATLLSVTALLLAVAFGACVLPGLRAASIDPMEVMRAE